MAGKLTGKAGDETAGSKASVEEIISGSKRARLAQAASDLAAFTRARADLERAAAESGQPEPPADSVMIPGLGEGSAPANLWDDTVTADIKRITLPRMV